MIVKIRVSDWQPRHQHMAKPDFPLLSSFFFHHPSYFAPHTPPRFLAGISVWVNTNRMWTKKHTRAGINSPHGCVCVMLELSHIVGVCVRVGVCSVGIVTHRGVCVCACVSVCEVTTSSKRMCQAKERKQH